MGAEGVEGRADVQHGYGALQGFRGVDKGGEIFFVLLYSEHKILQNASRLRLADESGILAGSFRIAYFFRNVGCRDGNIEGVDLRTGFRADLQG